ncbi:MAG: protein translocase subunit SecF [Eubacteriaceae bacterium]|nr:protein translocase subunit SecF [Eubacteriaceae bacterium]
MKLKVMKHAKLFFIISSIVILIGLGFIFIKGLNYGIDFRGGTIVNIELGRQFTTDEIRQITDNYDKSADITYSGDNKTQVVISTKEDLSDQQRKQMFEDFQEKYNLDASALISIDKVSATIGSEMAVQSMWAIIAVIIGILIYVSIRFEFLFGFTAIVCLFHDVMIVISVYAIAQIQVNTPFIAAVLTILGFSINDTIVVFDRIRENRKKYGKHDYTTLVDDSVSQTIRRSINTTATVLIAITTLYILGVAEIRDFALPLIIGFLGGTYSSICIASPLWAILQERSDKKRKLKTARR